MTGGAPVDRRLASLACLAEVSIDGNVRSDRSGPQVMHKLGHVVTLVSAQGDPLPSSIPAIDQLQRLVAFGRARRLAHAAADRQAVAVLHQGMPHVAELGRLSVALLVEPCFRIGRALVRLVGALLLMEAPLGIPASAMAVIV